MITLNGSDEYTGGGTYMEDLDQAFVCERGHALLQASALRHAGHRIESGERWAGRKAHPLAAPARQCGASSAGRACAHMPARRAGRAHAAVTSRRWVMVLFLMAEEMQYGEHLRHFKSRAQRSAEDADEAGELRCLTLARALCDDCDHELLYDQAVGLHDRGDLPQAVQLYERAQEIARGRGPRITSNLAAARQQMLDGAGHATPPAA